MGYGQFIPRQMAVLAQIIHILDPSQVHNSQSKWVGTVEGAEGDLLSFAVLLKLATVSFSRGM